MQTQPKQTSARTTDPLAYFCCCNYRKVGHNYIIYEPDIAASSDRVSSMVIVGPHWIGVIITWLIITIAVILVMHGQYVPGVFTAVSLVFYCATCYFLYLTACTDAGIVGLPQLQYFPVQPSRTNENLEDGNFQPRNDKIHAGYKYTALLYPDDGPNLWKNTFCDICNVIQDPCTIHCDACGVCIAGLHHHCIWMGKCIGKNNMRAFKLFIISLVLYLAFVSYLCISGTHGEYDTDIEDS